MFLITTATLRHYGDVVALACALSKAVPKKRRTKALDFLQLTLKKECVRRCPDFAVFCVLSL